MSNQVANQVDNSSSDCNSDQSQNVKQETDHQAEVKFTVVIPARYDSSRLPGKVLLPIGDRSMLQHVYEKAVESGAQKVVIATDDERVFKAATDMGAAVCLTASTHQTGTDRIVEAILSLRLQDDEIVVNLQGDEPFMPSLNVHQVAYNLHHQPTAAVATLCEPMNYAEDVLKQSQVKVVMNREGMAHWFSRSSIPWSSALQEHRLPSQVYFRHLGIYAYRVRDLKIYQQWEHSPYESMERLEQLRWLWQGKAIHVDIAEQSPEMAGIDTQEDIEKSRELVV